MEERAAIQFFSQGAWCEKRSGEREGLRNLVVFISVSILFFFTFSIFVGITPILTHLLKINDLNYCISTTEPLLRVRLRAVGLLFQLMRERTQ